MSQACIQVLEHSPPSGAVGRDPNPGTPILMSQACVQVSKRIPKVSEHNLDGSQPSPPYIYIYIYIYTERERDMRREKEKEREREREREIEKPSWVHPAFPFFEKGGKLQIRQPTLTGRVEHLPFFLSSYVLAFSPSSELSRPITNVMAH